MKLLTIFAAAAGLTLFCSATSTSTEPVKKQVARPISSATTRAKLLATRTMLIDRKKALRDRLQNSMPLQEEKIRDQNADYEVKKELFEKNLITKAELDDSERVLSNTRLEAERMRTWIAEDNRALALAEESGEAEAKGSAKRTAVVGSDAPPEWSLAGVAAIERFFRERFDRALPISAMGQSDTHDRLGLDHRSALDVALRPDSKEGRELIDYLRRAGIPYIAFRGKISSVSTGAHIHIGPRSTVLASVRYLNKRGGSAGSG
jgi:hypothetical protein